MKKKKAETKSWAPQLDLAKSSFDQIECFILQVCVVYACARDMYHSGEILAGARIFSLHFGVYSDTGPFLPDTSWRTSSLSFSSSTLLLLLLL